MITNLHEKKGFKKIPLTFFNSLFNIILWLIAGSSGGYLGDDNHTGKKYWTV